MIYYKLWSRAEIVENIRDRPSQWIKMSENPQEDPEQADTRKLPSTGQYQAFPLDFKHFFFVGKAHRESSPPISGLD